MKVLMFSWEFPPLIAGGLAMACYGMVKSLLKKGIEVDLVLPTKEMLYFPFRKPEDVDTLPMIFVEPTSQVDFRSRTFDSLQKRLEYIGLSYSPETYLNQSEITIWSTVLKESLSSYTEYSTVEERVMYNLSHYLVGEEDIFKKVQEMTNRALKFAKILNFDLIHAHDWLCYPAGIIAKKITDRPLVTHMHATEFDRAGGWGNGRIHHLEYSGLAYADLVATVSRYTANMVISQYQVDSGKIRILYNAYDVTTIPEKKNRLFKGPTILFLGRITLQKGPEYFVEMAKKVLLRNPQARFIMAGSGDMARKILRLSASLKLKNKFVFAGFLNRQQVEEILNAIDIFVMPSVSEPFGIVPLEAMAYGAAAVISKQSGVAEVIQNAYKVDFWDVDEMARMINYLVENPEECTKLGFSGQEEVNRIGWDEVADKLMRMYQELV